MIEKLGRHIWRTEHTVFGDTHSYKYPDEQEMMDKINELIEAVNRLEGK